MRQRRLQQAQAEHLRRLRGPHVGTRHGGRHAITLGALERVGQRQGEQATHRIVHASIDQAINPRRLQQAARRVVHQHPVVRRRAALDQHLQACGDGLRARCAATSSGLHARTCGVGKITFEMTISRRQHDERGFDARHGSERAQRVRHHGAPGQLGVLLGQRLPRALAAAGTGHQCKAARRKASGGGRKPGRGHHSILELPPSPFALRPSPFTFHHSRPSGTPAG